MLGFSLVSYRRCRYSHPSSGAFPISQYPAEGLPRAPPYRMWSVVRQETAACGSELLEASGWVYAAFITKLSRQVETAVPTPHAIVWGAAEPVAHKPLRRVASGLCLFPGKAREHGPIEKRGTVEMNTPSRGL